MARPRKKPKDRVGVAFTVRLTPEVAERVELLRSRFQDETPITTVTTADVLRHLINEGSASAAVSLSHPKTTEVKKKD